MTIDKALILVTVVLMVYTFIDFFFVRQDVSSILVNVNVEKHTFMEHEQTMLLNQLHISQTTRNPQVSAYQWNGTFSLSNICDHSEKVNPNCLYFYKSYPVFLYDKKLDRFVSRQIMKTGFWKPALSKAILSVMKKYPDMMFVDIGGGLGMFSLEIGMEGFDAILVDPSVANVQRFCASVKLKHMKGSVSIVLNPLSSRHETLHMAAESDRLSEWFIMDDNPLKMAQTNSSSLSLTANVVATTLDDLLYLPELRPSRSLVVYLDTAGYDEKVLRGGEFFFSLKKITILFTDWKYNRNPIYSGNIMKYLVFRGFQPFDINLRISLLEKQQSDWPETIAWINKSFRM